MTTEQVPSKELDDCPRCGGDPGLVFNHPAIGPSYVWVKCECGLRGIEHEYHHGDEKEAIAAARAWWNERRSHEPTAPASKERFKIRQWVQTWLFSGTVRQTVNMEWPGEFIEDVVSMLAAWRTQSAHEPVATPAAESGLIRYDIRPGFPDKIEFNFDPNGEWVRFDDVWPELQQLRARASQPPSPEPLATVVCEWIERRRKELSKQGITGGHYIADLCLLEEAINNCLSPSLTKPAEPCEKCGGSGRLMIYDNSLYMGQLCSPIGDEPCPACSSEGERDE